MPFPVMTRAELEALGLKPGEFQLFCDSCGWKAEKNAAMKPVCPACGERLFMAWEDEERKQPS